MAEVFVSYRHDDWLFAKDISKRLKQAFGKDIVFRDRESLQYGELYRERIEGQLALCRVVLVVISGQLLQATTHAGTNDPLDFFHLEIGLALKRSPPIEVIPLVVEGTKVPDQKELPPDLAGLFKRHREVITDRHFEDDVNDLIRQLAMYGVGAVKRTVSFITAGCLLGVGGLILGFRHDGLGYALFAIPVLLAGLILTPLAKTMRWPLK